jgi:hypothetical protein
MLTKKATANISSFLATIAVKAASETSPLAPHVVKDLQQQAQQQAQARGGVTDPSKIKQPGSFNPYLTGSLIGAGAGGLVGLLGETRKKKKDRNYLRSVLGTGLAGAGLGLGLGALPTALQNIQAARAGTQSIGEVGGGASGGTNGGGAAGAGLGTTDGYYQSDNFTKRLLQSLGVGSLFGAGMSRTGLSTGLGARNVGQYVKDKVNMLVRPTATTQREVVDVFMQRPSRRVEAVPEGLTPYKDKPGGFPLSYEAGMRSLAQNPARFRDYQNQIAQDRQNIANARITAPQSRATQAMEARLAADKVMQTFVADNLTKLRGNQQAATANWIKDRPGGRGAFAWNTAKGVGIAEALRYLQNKITGGGY